MIRAVAFCPHPPLLVPELAQGAAAELDELRAACRTAIERVATGAETILVIGPGPSARFYPPQARGTLAGYGVELEIPLGSDVPGSVELPLSLTIGAWLLREALGPDCGARGCSIGPDAAVELRGTGADTALALVVMGDGSARRSTSAPGYLDERAEPFDAAVAAALRSGDARGLHVDLALGDALLAAGAPVWHALAGPLGTTHWHAELLYDAAPYGVGYFVAAWTADA